MIYKITQTTETCKDNVQVFSGTLEQLLYYWKSVLMSGHNYDVHVNACPDTITKLIDALNKAYIAIDKVRKISGITQYRKFNYHLSTDKEIEVAKARGYFHDLKNKTLKI